MDDEGRRPQTHSPSADNLVLTVSYLEKYGPAADEELPLFEGL